MPPEPSLSRRRLGAELRRLRAATGLALRPFGTHTGIAFARVRRIEKGEVVPNVRELRAWFKLTEASRDLATRLAAAADSARQESASWADLLESAGGQHLNDVAAAREETATLTSSYQAFMVPGLLQVSAYTRALLPYLAVQVEPEAHLAGQLQRQEALHSDRRFRFLLTQRAWAWGPGGVAMDAQHDRIHGVTRLPNVDVRVLEDDATPLAGYSSFTVYDSPKGSSVVVELEHDRLALTDDDQVQRYHNRYGWLWNAAQALS